MLIDDKKVRIDKVKLIDRAKEYWYSIKNLRVHV